MRSTHHRSLQGNPLSKAIMLACLSTIISPPIALAQTVPPSSTAQATQVFNIPAGSLDQVLNQFAVSTGILLAINGSLTEGLTSQGLNGTYSVENGLSNILAGSGLTLRFTGENSVTIEPIKQNEVVTLPALTVLATGMGEITEGSGSFTTRSMSSATHLPLSMRETPQSVTVLTSARIEADNLIDLTDIAKATPGLTVSSRNIRPVLMSRGYGIASVTQDGITSLYDWSNGDSLGNLAMQDRVEVVRGATGLMQGAGEPSGAVNMIRKRPTSTWQFKGSVSAGSWDDYRTMADVSGPLTEDGRVRGRAVGYFQDAGDFYDLAFNDKRLGYVTVDVDLTDRTTLNLGYSHLYSNKNLSWGGMPTSYEFQHLNLPRSTFLGADWEYNKNEVDTFYASLVHDFGGGWALNFNGTYVDGRLGMQATWLAPTPDVGGYGHHMWDTQKSYDQKAADLKISGPVSWFGRQHDLVFGTTINRQNERYDQWFVWNPPQTSGFDPSAGWDHVVPQPDLSSSRDKSSLRFKQDSIYSIGKFNLADTMDLLLGGRLDWYDRVLSSGDSIWSSFSEKANLTKYAGLTWKFADQHSTYISYTDVFQPQSLYDMSGKLLAPVVGKNYEIGIKGEYLGGALNGSIALFRIDESNRAVYLSDQSACPIATGCFATAGLARTEGVDIELQGALTSNWQIGAGLTWSESRYRKDGNPDNIGKRLDTGVPMTLFKLSTQYTLPGELNRLTLGGRLNWQSKVYYDSENAYGEMVRNQQDAHTVVDLSASYSLTRNLNVKLDINNIFDKVYYSSIASSVGNSTEAYGRPRNALLTLSASF